ncbi:hypothetical protein EW146_g2439 [Bondarzewia mesenterica]|uniref:DUF2423 domain-containing protein n=1 Tax=Bondarzewia mesenterica TaxID=1095465 RepID=A0A4S4M2W0_9AGAM|nr:hypothetical protein EW146_g2439 [Bondarzewia mesenterica]
MFSKVSHLWDTRLFEPRNPTNGFFSQASQPAPADFPFLHILICISSQDLTHHEQALLLSSNFGKNNQMAKSTRSKVKRSFRSKKREHGVYAAVEAARLQRLNAKLRALTADEQQQENEGDEEEGGIGGGRGGGGGGHTRLPQSLHVQQVRSSSSHPTHTVRLTSFPFFSSPPSLPFTHPDPDDERIHGRRRRRRIDIDILDGTGTAQTHIDTRTPEFATRTVETIKGTGPAPQGARHESTGIGRSAEKVWAIAQAAMRDGRTSADVRVGHAVRFWYSCTVSFFFF